MSIHKDVARISSTLYPDSISGARTSGETDTTITELEHQRQDSSSELPLLRKTQSTPIISSSGDIPETARGRRKAFFKIDLPPRNPDGFVGNYENDLPRVVETKVIEHPITISKEPSISKPVSPSCLTSWKGSQTPSESLPPKTSPTSFAPPLDTAIMASDDSDDTITAKVEQIETPTDLELNIDNIATAAVDHLLQAHLTAVTLDVVHQPLPFPLPSRLSGINSLNASIFSRLIDFLRHESGLTASHIRIQHVLSNNILPESYPVSPLVTPSSLARNSDEHGYFAVKTLFSSISTSTGVALPPSQAHLCITERVIPPSGEVELSLFLNDGIDSGFMTRLNELDKGGIFILVLPTSRGGRTFHNNYLSKILDPILRTIVFRLGLQSELAVDISNAIALNQLRSFQEMEADIQKILHTANTNTHFPAASPTFEIVHASKGTITLNFESWYTWWLGQNRARIMSLLDYHINMCGQGLASVFVVSSNDTSSATRASVMLELDKEMRIAGAEQVDVPGIELAVFMIQRAR